MYAETRTSIHASAADQRPTIKVVTKASAVAHMSGAHSGTPSHASNASAADTDKNTATRERRSRGLVGPKSSGFLLMEGTRWWNEGSGSWSWGYWPATSAGHSWVSTKATRTARNNATKK